MQGAFYREIVDSDTISIQNLPDELKHTKVELIILPYTGEEKKIDLNSIKGIWKDTDITLKEIRKKAWER